MSQSMAIPFTRKTRFVCISDTHNASVPGSFHLPKGDVLIHAGDLTNQGSYSELQKTIKWIQDADCEVKIIIAGNHDITLDTDFYVQHGSYFHNQERQDPQKCQNLLESSSIIWLKHESVVIKLFSPSGPRTTFKIFGSPFSPAKGHWEKGNWAFGYDAEDGQQIWERIPLDSDIIVTHTPPKYHCDEAKDRRAAGCDALRKALWRIRPRLAICGHVHEGRGGERVLWNLEAPDMKYKEEGVERWEDPSIGTKKMSLVDLSSQSGNPLRNDGSTSDLESGRADYQKASSIVHDILPVSDFKKGAKPTAILGVTQITSKLLAIRPEALPSATKGQGGIPPSQRCDLAALSGRMGRKETYVINAAIMNSNWPHKTGGKSFNKPIVVDIDLPVFEAANRLY